MGDRAYLSEGVRSSTGVQRESEHQRRKLGEGSGGHAISTETTWRAGATQGGWNQTKSERDGSEPFPPISEQQLGWFGRLGPESFEPDMRQWFKMKRISNN